MKKHNEGYTLVVVLVVLVVLCLLSAFILTAALRNLEAQQSSVQQMQDRYTAQGEIEKIVAQISKNETLPDNLEKDEEGNLILTVRVGSVQIDCVLKIEDDVVNYLSYDISMIGGGTE